MLFGDSRSGTGNRISVPLVHRLKRDLSQEGFTAVRQGAWSRLTSAGEGKVPFEAQALSQRLNEFLNGKGQLGQVAVHNGRASSDAGARECL